MDFHPDFFDSRGLLKPQRTDAYGQPDKDAAFNGFIYTAYLVRLLGRNVADYDLAFEYADRIQRAYNVSDKDLSHDDMTGICCSWVKPYEPKWSRYWYRTEALLYLFKLGYKWTKLLFPILYLKMMVSCWNKSYARNGSPDTDGPLLSWLILQSEHLPIVQKVCYAGLKHHFGESYLEKLFEIKFPRNEDHPCRILSRSQSC